MEIIDYFHSARPSHWLEQIRRCEWRAAAFLAHLLETQTFHQTLGRGTLYLLTDGDELVSFLTLAERDCIDAPEYAPWIGFVYTAPEYRGRRCAGRLIEHAVGMAAKHGAEQVYICTDHVGLYEKYGFTYLENRVSIYGEDSRVYVRKTAPYHVEALTADMLPLLFEFEQRLSEEEPGFYRWTEEADYQKKVEASFQEAKFDQAISLVAMTEDRIVGRIDAAIIPTHFDGSMKGYLDWICVLKSWRHRGVAQALMTALRRTLHERGIDTLVGLIAANEEAQRFYRSMENTLIRDEGIWIDC